MTVLRLAPLCAAILGSVAAAGMASAQPSETPSDKVEKVVVTGKKTIRGATKTDTPIKEVPQSISVISGDVIKDQNNVSVSEAIRNVSGVVANNPLQTPAYDSTYIRGFPAEQWLDGIPTYYNAGDRDTLVNADRIEVLKGPNAILYGGGTGAPLGGVVNVVSKLPSAEASAELGVRIGSHSFFQPWVDVNQPLSGDGTILFRVTGDYTTSESFIDVIETERYSLNPTLTLTDNAGTSLTVQGRLSNWQGKEYQGLPATGSLVGPFTIDRDAFIGPSDIPESESSVQSVTAKLDHRFDETWSAGIQARVGHTEFEEVAQNYVGLDFAANEPVFGSSWSVFNLLLTQEQDEVSVNGNVVAKFDAGGTQNTVLIGADYTRITDYGFMYGDLNDLILLGLVDLTAPVYPPYVEPAQTFANTIVDGDNTYTTKGLYAQIQSTLWESVHVLGGLRLASLEIDSFSPAFGLSSTTDETKLLPRIGAVVDVTPEISLYADYSEGLKGNPFVFYAGTPKPEENDQIEAGVKFDFGSGFSGTAAVFEINRSGVPIFTGIASEAIGEQRSRGFDIDLAWVPTPNWFFLANYAHIDAELTADAGGGLAGNQLNLIPPDSGRFWASYRFDGAWQGWSLGAGLYAVSDTIVDAANVYETNGYVTVDAKIAYNDEMYSAALAVKNLTNEKYFVPFNYYGGRVAPGEDIAVYATFAVRLR